MKKKTKKSDDQFDALDAGRNPHVAKVLCVLRLLHRWYPDVKDVQPRNIDVVSVLPGRRAPEPLPPPPAHLSFRDRDDGMRLKYFASEQERDALA